MVSRTADPTADVAPVEGKRGKKAARAAGAATAGEGTELLSKLRPEPEAELLSRFADPAAVQSAGLCFFLHTPTVYSVQ